MADKKSGKPIPKKTTKKSSDDDGFGLAARQKRKRRKRLISIVLVLVIILVCFIVDRFTYVLRDVYTDAVGNPDPKRTSQKVTGIVPAGKDELLVHMVDVGQGDCIILQLPDGKTMIIDGGKRSAKNIVLNYIESAGIKVFDYLILTHTDEDHVGSLDDVLLNTTVKNIYMPDIDTSVITTKVYRDFNDAVKKEKAEEGAAVHYNAVGQTIVSGDEANPYCFYWFTPSETLLKKLRKSQNAHTVNSVSNIMLLEYSGRKIMLTGDATAETEAEFVETLKAGLHLNPMTNRTFTVADVNVDILKSGHHGSDTSSSAEFVSLIDPEYALISVGKGNSYKHPKDEVLQRYKNYIKDETTGKYNLYRTDECGNVTVTLKPDTDTPSEPAAIVIATSNLGTAQGVDTIVSVVVPKVYFSELLYLFGKRIVRSVF